MKWRGKPTTACPVQQQLPFSYFTYIVQFGVGHHGMGVLPSHTIVPVNNNSEINSLNRVFMFHSPCRKS
jgi:hypothetical protein